MKENDFVLIDNLSIVGINNLSFVFIGKKVIDGDFELIVDGKKMVRVSTSCWFTSLEVKKHNDELTLYKRYNELDFPSFVNYNAINVNNYKEIHLNLLF